MALFSIAEARAFNGARLTSATDYPDVDITAKTAEIKAFLERACGVNFEATTHTAEVHDGDGSNYLELDWPLISTVSAISVDGVAFTAGELSTTDYASGLAIDPQLPIVTRRSGTFLAGWSNVSVTYTAGHATTPPDIKRAALLICTYEMPSTNLSPAAESYDTGEVSYSFGRGDGFNGNWHKVPEVMRAIRLHTRAMPGVA